MKYHLMKTKQTILYMMDTLLSIYSINNKFLSFLMDYLVIYYIFIQNFNIFNMLTLILYACLLDSKISTVFKWWTQN